MPNEAATSFICILNHVPTHPYLLLPVVYECAREHHQRGSRQVNTVGGGGAGGVGQRRGQRLGQGRRERCQGRTAAWPDGEGRCVRAALQLGWGGGKWQRAAGHGYERQKRIVAFRWSGGWIAVGSRGRCGGNGQDRRSCSCKGKQSTLQRTHARSIRHTCRSSRRLPIHLACRHVCLATTDPSPPPPAAAPAAPPPPLLPPAALPAAVPRPRFLFPLPLLLPPPPAPAPGSAVSHSLSGSSSRRRKNVS